MCFGVLSNAAMYEVEEKLAAEGGWVGSYDHMVLL